MRDVRTFSRRRLLLPLALVWALPLSCVDSQSGASASEPRCPFGSCTAPVSAEASAASPSAALVAHVQSKNERPAFVDFGLAFGDKLAANSIAVAEGLAECDAARAVSGVVLDLREAEGLDVAFDTAIACWATSSSQSPLAVVLVTVQLPYGTDEQLVMIKAALSNSDEDLQFPGVGASWAVGSSWRYSANNDGG